MIEELDRRINMLRDSLYEELKAKTKDRYAIDKIQFAMSHLEGVKSCYQEPSNIDLAGVGQSVCEHPYKSIVITKEGCVKCRKCNEII